MRTIALLASILVVTSFVPSLKAKDVIKDKSPDGKFALRIAKGEKDREAAIIDVRTKKALLDLDVYGNYVENMRLLWSKDLQRVAHFELDRRGGTTHIYFRNGSEFKEIPLPQIPECDAPAKQDCDEYLKTLEYSAKPERWLKSGALLLAVHDERTRNGGIFPKAAKPLRLRLTLNTRCRFN